MRSFSRGCSPSSPSLRRSIYGGGYGADERGGFCSTIAYDSAAMQTNDTEGWPLRRLNFVTMPAAPILAMTTPSFLAGVLVAAGIGTITAAILAVLFLQNFKVLMEQEKAANPLRHLAVSLEVAGLPRGKFILLQSLSGALIGAMWFCVAATIALLFR